MAPAVGGPWEGSVWVWLLETDPCCVFFLQIGFCLLFSACSHSRMSSSSSSWSRAPLWFIRSVVDSHTTHGVHHPWTSLAALVILMSLVLVLSVAQRAGQVSRGTTVGSFDADSSQPPSALGFTTLQFNRSGVAADGSTWQLAASGAVPLQRKSQCADLQSIFFMPLAGSTAVYHRLTPLSYEFYQPTCTHLWQFTSSGLRPADLLSRTALTGEFTLGLLRNTPGLACPSFHTPPSQRSNLQVFAVWPFNTCTVSNSGLGANTSSVVLLPSIDQALVGPHEIWDDHCWAGDSISKILEGAVAADFLNTCEQSFQALTFLNSFEHRTSLYDAVALTASVMTLAYALIKTVLRMVNTVEERRRGVLVDCTAHTHVCAACGASSAASDDSHSSVAPLKPMSSPSSRGALEARLLEL